MTVPEKMNVLMILGSGWLEYEAAIAAQSFTQHNPTIALYLAQPCPSALWPDPPLSQKHSAFADLGAQVIEFENRHFGARYPIGNKIEALFALPKGQPFAFFDTDTVFLEPLDLDRLDLSRPMASLRRTDTWPNLKKSNAQRDQIWHAVYEAAGLDLATCVDLRHPRDTFERYPYFNAGVIYGPCPHELAHRWIDAALAIEQSQNPLIQEQSLTPWLDQVSLGPVIASFGGGQDIEGAQYLDHRASCHYRRLPLAYAREAQNVIDQIETSAQRMATITKAHDASCTMIHDGVGRDIRRRFYPRPPNEDEADLRKALKAQGYWLR